MKPRKLPAILVVMMVVLILSFVALEHRSEIEIWARGGMEEIFKQEGETRLTYSMELSRVLEPSVVAEEVIDITLKRLRAYGFRYVTVGLQSPPPMATLGCMYVALRTVPLTRRYPRARSGTRRSGSSDSVLIISRGYRISSARKSRAGFW